MMRPIEATTGHVTFCRWPHCGMSRADELLFDIVVARHARFIRAVAGRTARETGLDADDLIQEVLIALWCIGPRRAIARGDRYIRSTVFRRMSDAARRGACQEIS